MDESGMDENHRQSILKPSTRFPLPDVPCAFGEDETVTSTFTRSRRVSFGRNMVKEFMKGSAVTTQAVQVYEQSSLSSSDQSDCSGPLDLAMNSTKLQPMPAPPDPVPMDSQAATRLFTENCISIAKSVFQDTNTELTAIIIGAKPSISEEDRRNFSITNENDVKRNYQDHMHESCSHPDKSRFDFLDSSVNHSFRGGRSGRTANQMPMSPMPPSHWDNENYENIPPAHGSFAFPPSTADFGPRDVSMSFTNIQRMPPNSKTLHRQPLMSKSMDLTKAAEVSFSNDIENLDDDDETDPELDLSSLHHEVAALSQSNQSFRSLLQEQLQKSDLSPFNDSLSDSLLSDVGTQNDDGTFMQMLSSKRVVANQDDTMTFPAFRTVCGDEQMEFTECKGPLTDPLEGCGNTSIFTPDATENETFDPLEGCGNTSNFLPEATENVVFDPLADSLGCEDIEFDDEEGVSGVANNKESSDNGMTIFSSQNMELTQNMRKPLSANIGENLVKSRSCVGVELASNDVPDNFDRIRVTSNFGHPNTMDLTTNANMTLNETRDISINLSAKIDQRKEISVDLGADELCEEAFNTNASLILKENVPNLLPEKTDDEEINRSLLRSAPAQNHEKSVRDLSEMTQTPVKEVKSGFDVTVPIASTDTLSGNLHSSYVISETNVIETAAVSSQHSLSSLELTLPISDQLTSNGNHVDSKSPDNAGEMSLESDLQQVPDLPSNNTPNVKGLHDYTDQNLRTSHIFIEKTAEQLGNKSTGLSNSSAALKIVGVQSEDINVPLNPEQANYVHPGSPRKMGESLTAVSFNNKDMSICETAQAYHVTLKAACNNQEVEKTEDCALPAPTKETSLPLNTPVAGLAALSKRPSLREKLEAPESKTASLCLDPTLAFEDVLQSFESTEPMLRDQPIYESTRIMNFAIKKVADISDVTITPPRDCEEYTYTVEAAPKLPPVTTAKEISLIDRTYQVEPNPETNLATPINKTAEAEVASVVEALMELSAREVPITPINLSNKPIDRGTKDFQNITNVTPMKKTPSKQRESDIEMTYVVEGLRRLSACDADKRPHSDSPCPGERIKKARPSESPIVLNKSANSRKLPNTSINTQHNEASPSILRTNQTSDKRCHSDSPLPIERHLKKSRPSNSPIIGRSLLMAASIRDRTLECPTLDNSKSFALASALKDDCTGLELCVPDVSLVSLDLTNLQDSLNTKDSSLPLEADLPSSLAPIEAEKVEDSQTENKKPTTNQVPETTLDQTNDTSPVENTTLPSVDKNDLPTTLSTPESMCDTSPMEGDPSPPVAENDLPNMQSLSLHMEKELLPPVGISTTLPIIPPATDCNTSSMESEASPPVAENEIPTTLSTTLPATDCYTPSMHSDPSPPVAENGIPATLTTVPPDCDTSSMDRKPSPPVADNGIPTTSTAIPPDCDTSSMVNDHSSPVAENDLPTTSTAIPPDCDTSSMVNDHSSPVAENDLPTTLSTIPPTTCNMSLMESEPSHPVAEIDLPTPMESDHSSPVDANVNLKEHARCSEKCIESSREYCSKIEKVLESQSKEENCIWKINNFTACGTEEGSLHVFFSLLARGLLLEMNFKSDEPWPKITNIKISHTSPNRWQTTVKTSVNDFGFEVLKNYISKDIAKLDSLKMVPHYLDFFNAFASRLLVTMKDALAVLEGCASAELNGTMLSFSLFVLPTLTASLVEIDLVEVLYPGPPSIHFKPLFPSRRLDEKAVRKVWSGEQPVLQNFVRNCVAYTRQQEELSGFYTKQPPLLF